MLRSLLATRAKLVTWLFDSGTEFPLSSISKIDLKNFVFARRFGFKQSFQINYSKYHQNRLRQFLRAVTSVTSKNKSFLRLTNFDLVGSRKEIKIPES